MLGEGVCFINPHIAFDGKMQFEIVGRPSSASSQGMEVSIPSRVFTQHLPYYPFLLRQDIFVERSDDRSGGDL